MGCASSAAATGSAAAPPPASANADPSVVTKPKLFNQSPFIPQTPGTAKATSGASPMPPMPSDLSQSRFGSSTNNLLLPPTAAAATAANPIRIDQTSCKEMCEDWVNTFSIREGKEYVTSDVVFKDVYSLLRTWPRGEEAGQILNKPTRGSTTSNESKNRGVKMSWLFAAWQHVTRATKQHMCSTRMFVELLIRPLLSESGTNYFWEYIPLQFRSENPLVFVSHAWDGMLKHLFLYPDTLKRNWPADCGLWIDIFAMQQLEDGPNADLLDEVKDIVHSIGKTVVIFPGDGTPEYSLLPVLRSWCVFEMHCTARDALQFRTALHGDLNDVDFHNQIVAFIDTLDASKHKSTYESDGNAVRKALLEGGVNVDAQLKLWSNAAMANRYDAVPIPPHLMRRLSSKNALNTFSSFRDLYVVDPKHTSSESTSTAPNF